MFFGALLATAASVRLVSAECSDFTEVLVNARHESQVWEEPFHSPQRARFVRGPLCGSVLHGQLMLIGISKAVVLLAPLVRSCPRAAPTRSLLVPARFSYSTPTPTRLATRSSVCSYPFCGQARARFCPFRGQARAPPGTGTAPARDPWLPLPCSCPYPLVTQALCS